MTPRSFASRGKRLLGIGLLLSGAALLSACVGPGPYYDGYYEGYAPGYAYDSGYAYYGQSYYAPGYYAPGYYYGPAVGVTYVGGGYRRSGASREERLYQH